MPDTPLLTPSPISVYPNAFTVLMNNAKQLSDKKRAKKAKSRNKMKIGGKENKSDVVSEKDSKPAANTTKEQGLLLAQDSDQSHDLNAKKEPPALTLVHDHSHTGPNEKRCLGCALSTCPNIAYIASIVGTIDGINSFGAMAPVLAPRFGVNFSNRAIFIKFESQNYLDKTDPFYFQSLVLSYRS